MCFIDTNRPQHMTYIQHGSANNSNVEKATSILQKYFLCDHCLGRMFTGQTYSKQYKSLGQKLRKCVRDTTSYKMMQHNIQKTCYICKGLFDEIDDMLCIMRDASKEYEFSSFGVGAIIKVSIIDRDDFIRSIYKLQGTDSIKTSLTKELGSKFAKIVGAKYVHLEPEISFTVQPAQKYCEVLSKPVVIYGRYTKHARGTSQKQDRCASCMGRGCYNCEFHGISGYDSVEGQISNMLFGMLGGTTAKFTWIGGEDRDSLVSGGGRPFFARIQFPKKRHIASSYKNKQIRLKSISLSCLQNTDSSFVKSMQFLSKVRIKVVITNEPYNSDVYSNAENINYINNGKNIKPEFNSSYKISDRQYLQRLKILSKGTIDIKTKNDTIVKKTILELKYRRDINSVNTVVVWATLEGGIPIKRLVTGDGVWPSISQILNQSCKCVQFDFEDVIILKHKQSLNSHVSSSQCAQF